VLLVEDEVDVVEVDEFGSVVVVVLIIVTSSIRIKASQAYKNTVAKRIPVITNNTGLI
jgi:hypothetical protein